jgi:hypothetical protein
MWLGADISDRKRKRASRLCGKSKYKSLLFPLPRTMLIQPGAPRGGPSDQDMPTRAVVTWMIFIEPEELYVRRSASRTSHGSNSVCPGGGSASLSRELHRPLRYTDGWDETIVAYLSSRSGEPVRIMSLVSQLRKCVRHRDRTHREKLKHDILMRVGALIRAGVIVRFQRKYVVARPACA